MLLFLQMALLLLFEKADSFNYKELLTVTKMSEDQFPRYVQSLLDAKLLTSNTQVRGEHHDPGHFQEGFLGLDPLGLGKGFFLNIMNLSVV